MARKRNLGSGRRLRADKVKRLLIWWDRQDSKNVGWAHSEEWTDDDSTSSGPLGAGYANDTGPAKRRRGVALSTLRRELMASLGAPRGFAPEREWKALDHDGPGWEWRP